MINSTKKDYLRGSCYKKYTIAIVLALSFKLSLILQSARLTYYKVKLY